VWDTPYTGLGYAPLPLVVDVRAEMLERAPQIVEAAALRARAAGVSVETTVRRGFPVDEICRVAEDRNARMIVIGSHHWGRVRSALHGSVSQGVVQSAHCPVIVAPAFETEAKADPRALVEV
jgi:nucleotide-binding universal stress UspA family protein